MRTLVWLRRDLRVNDNTALYEASRLSDEGIVAVFLLTPEQWRLHDDAPCKINFWLENLRCLSESLWKRGIPLLIETVPLFDDVPAKLLTLAKQHACEAIAFNNEYEVYESRRDADVEDLFSREELGVHRYEDRVIVAPGEVLTKSGGPYKVFTPFKRAWAAHVKERSFKTHPRPRKQDALGIQPSSVPEEVEGFPPDSFRADLWPVGEAKAQARLKTFCKERISHYDDYRDIPSLNGTSTLSPYLTAGVLSPRQCLSEAMVANRGRILNGDKGPTIWISELIWREFYTHILVAFPRVSMHRPFDLETERIKWRDDPTALAAWQQGKTGVPLVDAAMRQLARTGWMHNRLRMVSAMFLSKQLLIDWRMGERFFMQHLIDGDLAANNGGWQWSASTGTDAAPYFRIFNPFSQSKRFDPDGVFIQKLCPELEHVDAKALHDPAKLAKAKPKNYPALIVDLKKARDRALAAFD